MLTVILFWLYTSCLFFLYGWFVIGLIQRIFLDRDTEPVHFTTTWLTGLWVITTLANSFSLVSKLGLMANILLLAGAVGILGWMIIQKKSPGCITTGKMPLLAWILLAVITLTVLEKATHPVTNTDTGLYHAQAIRWMETYPVVPGLAALHTRFAFNSSWLTTNTVFSFSFLGLPSLHLVSSILFLVFQFYLVGGVTKILHGEYLVSNWLKLFMIPVSFYVIISQISAPGTDLPSAILVWFVLLEWLAQTEIKKPVPITQLILLSLLALYAVTIKLNTFPLLLAAGYTLFRLVQSHRWKWIFYLAVLGGFIYAPWLARYFFLSGYLVYPYTGIDLFNVDWKIPASRVQEDIDAIRAWELIPGQDTATTLAMSFREWFPLWFARHTVNQKVILQVIVSAPMFWIVAGFLQNRVGKAVRRHFISHSWIYITAFSGVLFWFMSAPKFRYGYGFLMIAFLLALAPLFTLTRNLLEKQSGRLPAVGVIGIILFQMFVLGQSFQKETITSRLILPTDYLTLSTGPCQLDGYTFWCAEWYDECWYDPFPCVPKVDPMVEFRTGLLEDGFRFIPDEN